MTVDDVTVFPVWAVILGFPIAALWRWIAGAAPRPVVLVELGAKDQRPGLRIPVTPTEAQEGPDPPAVPFTSSISEGTQTGTSTGSSVLVPCFS